MNLNFGQKLFQQILGKVSSRNNRYKLKQLLPMNNNPAQKVIITNLQLIVSSSIRQFRPKRFHKIDPLST
jgi:hypothetical protein